MIGRCIFCGRHVWPWQAKVLAWGDHLLCAVERHLMGYHQIRRGY